MIKIVLSLVVICFSIFAEAQQVIDYPTAAEQTHQELTIVKISLYKDSTVIDLSIENKRDQGGWFCADKNIYIENSKDHKRYNIINTKGIPTCPSVYNFKSVGEKLFFKLTFAGIPVGTKLLNLVEDCDKSCFKFNEIILDTKLNNDIKLYSKGVELYAADNTKDAIECFTKVVEEIPEFPTHVYGYSFFNLIRIYFTKGDKVTARYWYDQLDKSNLPDKQYFINALKNEGIQIK
jgi:tetratricopeptide (TPR) repeat protein